MTDLVSCLSLVETRPGVFFPCAREHGHEGPHNPGACGVRYRYCPGSGEYACTLMRGHAGAHVSWVEQADAEADTERDYEFEREREQARG